MRDAVSKVSINSNLNNIINKSKDTMSSDDKSNLIKKSLLMVIETLDKPILVFKNGSLLCCNYVIKKMLGLDLQAMKDFNYKEILNPLEVQKFNSIINKLHKYPCKDYINVKTKNNKDVKIKIQYVTDMIDDDMYSVIFLDNEQINDSFNKDNEEITINLFHELKTPINILLSAVQVTNYMIKLEKLKNSKRIIKYLGIMKQNCFRLMKLTNNIIDLKKIKSGYYKVNLENNDIVKIVKNISMSVTEYVNSKGKSIEFNSYVEKKVIACDPDKIERVILNLISNAVKFTPQGGHIYVNIYDKKDKIVISVKDTGIGIPKDMRDHIFDKYVQVDDSLHINKSGSGIGLYLVKNIVESHGGIIYVNSEYDDGCEFIIELPCRTKEDDNTYKNDIEESFTESSKEKINIEFSDIE